MTSPRVYVVVINWNGLEHLEACYDALVANAYENVTFLLLDNASSDASVQFVQERYGHDPRVEVLVLPENRGWSGGNNAGIDSALAHGADYVFLLNNDTAVAPDCIAQLVAASEADAEIGALAPKMLIYDTPAIINSTGLLCSIIGASWDRGIGRLDDPRWDEAVPVIGVCGGAMWLRAAALRKTGPLPEAFEIYLDDLDLSLQIWKAGYQIRSCPPATVRHKFSATLGSGNRALHKYYLNTRNRFWLMMRHFPPSRFPEVAPAVVAGEIRAIGRALLDRDPWRAWAHLRAWGAALGYLPAARAYRREEALPRGAEAFWPMVIRNPRFCPAVVFPVHGWYPEIALDQRVLRPFAREAWLETTEDALRVTLVNRYPQQGPLTITVTCGDAPPRRVTVAEVETIGLEPRGARLCFASDRVLSADDTGESMDIGGWVAVESATGA